MTEKDVYKDLVAHIRNWIFGLPDSPILMEMLQRRFSPEEAEFLARFPHRPSALDSIAQGLGMNPDELFTKIEPMIAKGLICEFEGKSGNRYCFTDPVFFLYRMPGWKGETDHWNQEIARLANNYYLDGFAADFMGHPTKGLRAIPVGKTITDGRRILPYEDVVDFMEREDFHSVTHCACRHRHNADPTAATCRHDTENCLHFGKLGAYTVKYGIGRRITKEETRDILAKAADSGLVHGISNSKTGMDTICNCCSCCCLFLETARIPVAYPMRHQRSNYELKLNLDTCKACGLCVKRCPVDAMIPGEATAASPNTADSSDQKALKKPVHVPEKCIGCGVCAHKCPTQSIALVRRETEEDIAETLSELGLRMLLERGVDPKKVF